MPHYSLVIINNIRYQFHFKRDINGSSLGSFITMRGVKEGLPNATPNKQRSPPKRMRTKWNLYNLLSTILEWFPFNSHNTGWVISILQWILNFLITDVFIIIISLAAISLSFANSFHYAITPPRHYHVNTIAIWHCYMPYWLWWVRPLCHFCWGRRVDWASANNNTSQLILIDRLSCHFHLLMISLILYHADILSHYFSLISLHCHLSRHYWSLIIIISTFHFSRHVDYCHYFIIIFDISLISFLQIIYYASDILINIIH